jgi:aspartyl-tRNA(Asn)/glutamyl-tRNA(Gln) amidotransferase subunit B
LRLERRIGGEGEAMTESRSAATARDLDPLAGTPFEAVIGLEVHVQLATQTKMFCRCRNLFGAEPNTLTCPVCLGLAGALPAINREAMRQAARVGLACGSTISRLTKFDRKNYFYPDLPKNYQISQHDTPICVGGELEFLLEEGKRRVGLIRIHLEEDAGKNIHVEAAPVSWVDLNRAGVPLLEIVTLPEIRSPEEAGAFLRMLRLIMLYLEVSDCNMEEGSLRCDANVSIRPRGSDRLETRTEIKNLNSFSFIENALAFELRRQARLRQRGEPIVQETRLYDPERGETRPLRGKEEAHDYRYFPEPDLAPLNLSEEWIAALAATIPELPVARAGRFQRSYGLSPYHVELLVRERAVADFFERAVEFHPQPRSVGNWVINALREEMNARKLGIAELGIGPERFVELVRAVDAGLVSTQKARDVFRAMLEDARPVAQIISELGLEQISDDALLATAVEAVLATHPGPVDDVRRGKKNSINFLVGQVMRQTKGKANPARVTELIRRALGIG